MLTSAADSHLIDVNYLVEPYRLPHKTAVPVTQSAHSERVPAHVGNAVHRGESQQRLRKTKESEHLAVNGQRKNAVDAKIANDDAKKIPPNKKIAPGGDIQQDVDYDENTEVELDKEDVKFFRPRAVEAEDEVRQNVMITGNNLPRVLVARSAAGQKHSRDNVRVLFKYRWFLLVVAVFLLSFWLRCMRCVRCGFLLRRCRWLYSLTD